MSLTISCACGQRYAVDEQYAGRQVQCPACASMLTVGGSPAAVAPAESRDPITLACACGQRVRRAAGVRGAVDALSGLRSGTVHAGVVLSDPRWPASAATTSTGGIAVSEDLFRRTRAADPLAGRGVAHRRPGRDGDDPGDAGEGKRGGGDDFTRAGNPGSAGFRSEDASREESARKAEARKAEERKTTHA